VLGRGRASGTQALSIAFRDAVAAARAGDGSPDAPLVGLEHEFRVVRGGERVPFESLIESLDLGRRYLDPTDANARRLPSGVAITCDEAEAELALPPVSVVPGFARRLATAARRERAALQDRLSDDVRLVGVSTHLSVSVSAGPDVTDALAQLYGLTFAPAMMLLLDRRESGGIYVRPRPGRLELCGEFAQGERLEAAAAFAVGSVHACLAVVEGRVPASSIPPMLRLPLDAGIASRFGYTVWRSATGDDLYRHGRAAMLPTAAGATTTAQAQLEAATGAVFAALRSVGVDDLRPLERFVHGDFPLPLPTARGEGHSVLPVDVDTSAGPAPGGEPSSENPYGRVAVAIRRPGYEMAPVMLTWPLVVLVAAALPQPRRAFLCVPRADLATFVAALDRGSLDEIVRRYLRERPGRSKLELRAQAAQLGIYDRLGRRRELLPAEPTGPSGVLAVAA